MNFAKSRAFSFLAITRRSFYDPRATFATTGDQVAGLLDFVDQIEGV